VPLTDFPLVTGRLAAHRTRGIMNTARLHHRLPRAEVDRISTPAAAIQMLAMSVHRPLRHETIVLALDAQRRGLAVVVVTGTRRPDDVLEVVEFLTAPATHDGQIAAIIVASVRPDAPAGAGPGDDLDEDVDRWLEMSDIAEDAGVELIEWFVVGRRLTCPRDRLGEPPRW
jgi:hypothetical protein